MTKFLATLTLAASLFLAGCIHNPPNPPNPQPTTRSFEIALASQADNTKVTGVNITLDGRNVHVGDSGSIREEGIKDCPHIVVVDVPETDKFKAKSESFGPEQVACGNVVGSERKTILLEPKPVPPVAQLPTPPTRDQLLDSIGKFNFQGYLCDINGGGRAERIWEPLISINRFTPDQRARLWACKKATGDKAVNLSLGLDGMAGVDFALEVAHEAARNGFNTLLAMMGDGNGRTDEMHYDAGALGYYWLMENFRAINDKIIAKGLDKFIARLPGYDGVVPAWQRPNGNGGAAPEGWRRLEDFVNHARPILGDSVLCVEMSSGYMHSYSGETDDFGTPVGQKFDCVLWEGPIDFGPIEFPLSAQDKGSDTVEGDFCKPEIWSNVRKDPFTQIWAMAKRGLGPDWIRPSNDMPFCEDQGMYNGGPNTVFTPRGKMYVYAFEYYTYKYIRLNGDHCGVDNPECRLTTAQVRQATDYLKKIGWTYVNGPGGY